MLFLCLLLNVLYTYMIWFKENPCISAVKPNDENSIMILNDIQLLYSYRLLWKNMNLNFIIINHH